MKKVKGNTVSNIMVSLYNDRLTELVGCSHCKVWRYHYTVYLKLI